MGQLVLTKGLRVLCVHSSYRYMRCPIIKRLPGGEDLVPLPEEVLKNMSTDQKSCYKLLQAVKEGILPVPLQEMKCGPLNHARFAQNGNHSLQISSQVAYYWSETCIHVDKKAWSYRQAPQVIGDPCEVLYDLLFSVVL